MESLKKDSIKIIKETDSEEKDEEDKDQTEFYN